MNSEAGAAGPADAILRAVDFVEAHLKEEITVADMAAAAGYSLFHFVRVFDKLVQHTPYEYLMRRRLSEAAGELLETPHKVTDLALAYRFHSPEVFTRAFRRMFDVTPLEYRRAGAADPHTRLSPRTLEHLLLAGELARQPPRRVEWPRHTLAGLMTPIRPAADERRALWAAFRSAWEALDMPATTGFYGVTLYPPGWWQHGAFYLAGAEVLGEAPGLLVTLRLPAGAYVTFGGPHPVERLPRLRELIYQTWLPRLEGRRATLEVECFGEHLPEGEIIPESLAIAVC